MQRNNQISVIANGFVGALLQTIALAIIAANEFTRNTMGADSTMTSSNGTATYVGLFDESMARMKLEMDSMSNSMAIMMALLNITTNRPRQPEESQVTTNTTTLDQDTALHDIAIGVVIGILGAISLLCIAACCYKGGLLDRNSATKATIPEAAPLNEVTEDNALILAQASEGANEVDWATEEINEESPPSIVIIMHELTPISTRAASTYL